MTYRDMTFCTCWKRCRKGADCDRACTGKTMLDAKNAGELLSMANFEDQPCFEPLQNDDRIFNVSTPRQAAGDGKE